MSSQTPQITQLIVNDIANSQLSSYQIAYKYHISKTSVDHIGRSHLGDSLYDQKEQLACQKLNEDIQTLKDQGLSSNKIGIRMEKSLACINPRYLLLSRDFLQLPLSLSSQMKFRLYQ